MIVVSMAANNELVVFALGERLIGVPASTVRELRGTLVPVADLSSRLGLTPRPMRASDQLLICEVSLGALAVRADRVIEIRVVGSEAVPSGTEADPIVRGLARAAEGVIVIAELAAFLAEPDVAALATAISRLGAAA
jgi:chemotaxis signal transduction protein